MKVFLSGISGSGMSSLAGLFCQKGFDVCGSDIHFYPPVDKILEKINARVFKGFHRRNIPADVDLCIIGNVVSRGNPEAEFILNQGIPFDSMAGALYKYFIRGKKSIVVSGTHGKTTIASFVSYLLDRAGLQPGFFIGGKPVDFDRNYETGAGDYFVTEGDEYETSFFDRSSKFLKYYPHYLIMTSLEYDHVDFFPNRTLYLKSFQNLVNQVPSEGVIISHADFPMNLEAIKNAITPVISYGFENGEYRIENIEVKNKGYYFSLRGKTGKMDFQSTIMGRYNLLNLSAGILLGLHLNIPEQIIKESVSSFGGVERRFRLINQIRETLFLEDFAHHPTSLRNLLLSLKETFPGKKIIALFEPRSWSLRRNIFQNELTESFKFCDELWIQDVYQKEKIPLGERLDVRAIRAELEKAGKPARIFDSYDDIKKVLTSIDFKQEQVIALISNGDFGGIPSFVKNLRKGG
jgi:UDP-N-acetylmuramate: L-alanyl-gamma-D-glutamyl-meso-diaminopimelate ligase